MFFQKIHFVIVVAMCHYGKIDFPGTRICTNRGCVASEKNTTSRFNFKKTRKGCIPFVAKFDKILQIMQNNKPIIK